MNSPQSLLPSDLNQIVILVVDDEPIVLNVTRLMLEKEGYFVLPASDGEEALSLARGYRGTINLLLSDIVMPKMDGYSLRAQLLLERPAMRILMMSGRVLEPKRSEPFLHKPFDRTMLANAVRDVLAARRSTMAV